MSKYIKRMLSMGLVVVVACIMFCGCEVDDSDKRTFRGTVYDVAYSRKEKSGLRSRVYYHYLFSESDKKVLYCYRYTAGNGSSKVVEGTYEGSLDDRVVIKYKPEDEGWLFIFEDSYMKSEDGEDIYSKSDVKRAIYDAELWAD